MIEPENLKIGLLWYQSPLKIEEAIKAFVRRFGFEPDTVYHSKKNYNEDFGCLRAIEDGNRLPNCYLLCKTKEDKKHVGNLEQMTLL